MNKPNQSSSISKVRWWMSKKSERSAEHRDQGNSRIPRAVEKKSVENQASDMDWEGGSAAQRNASD